MVEQVTLRGVVLSSMPISEYDKRLVILTKERGKITAFARGARKQNSQFLAASQPMTFGEYTVYQGRNAYTVTGAKVTKYFAESITDIEKMSYGMYFLEICDYFGREGVEASDSINLVFLAIKALINPAIPDRLVRTIFELKSLVINGEYPNFFNCCNCGERDNLQFFDRRRYSMLCSKCKANGCANESTRNGNEINLPKVHIALDESSVYSLQYIIASPISKLFSFNVNDEVLGEINEVVNYCFTKVVDRDFKSLEFLL